MYYTATSLLKGLLDNTREYMLCPKHTTSRRTAAPLWPATQFSMTLLFILPMYDTAVWSRHSQRRELQTRAPISFFIYEVVVCPLALLQPPAQKECVSDAVYECFNVFSKAFHRTQSICSDAEIVDDS